VGYSSLFIAPAITGKDELRDVEAGTVFNLRHYDMLDSLGLHELCGLREPQEQLLLKRI
jgi:hypothetical protein